MSTTKVARSRPQVSRSRSRRSLLWFLVEWYLMRLKSQMMLIIKVEGIQLVKRRGEKIGRKQKKKKEGEGQCGIKWAWNRTKSRVVGEEQDWRCSAQGNVSNGATARDGRLQKIGGRRQGALIKRLPDRPRRRDQIAHRQPRSGQMSLMRRAIPQPTPTPSSRPSYTQPISRFNSSRCRLS